MKKHTIWFNKSLANIVNVVAGVRAADKARQLNLIVTHPVKELGPMLEGCVFKKEPDVLGKAYLEWALRFCKDHGIDVFVCGKQSRYLANHKAAFAAQGTILMTACSNAIADCLDDKDQAYRAMLAGGLGDIVPAYQVASTPTEFANALTALESNGPLCFKPTVSVYGIGFRILTDETNKSSLDRLLSGDTTYVSKSEMTDMLAGRESFKTLMVMELLEGDERSIDCLAHEGKLVTCVIRRKLGQSQVLEDNPTLVAHVQRLVTLFGLDNFFNAQFREKDGKYYLLEINPRMSGGTHYTFHSGVTMPYMGIMLKLSAASLTDLPTNQTGVEIYPVEGSVGIVAQAMKEAA